MNDSITPLKRCSCCGEEFPPTTKYFHRQSKRKSGLQNWCKTCFSKHRKTYRQTHKEAERQNQQTWREANRDKHGAQARRYQKRYPTKIKARKHEYYELHKDSIKERVREWEKQNPERYRLNMRVKARARSAQKRANGGGYTGKDVLLQIKAQTDKKGILRCWWCGKKITGAYHLDHRIPLIKGGSNWPENICISCPVCNLSKSGKLPHEWNGRLL